MRNHSRMKKPGGNVKPARIEKAVADIFATGGFERILQLYPTIDEAHTRHLLHESGETGIDREHCFHRPS